MGSDYEYNDPLLSQKPGDDSSGASGMEFILRKFLMERIDTALPAMVLAFDREKNVATIKPLILRVDVKNEMFERGSIYEVSCLSLGTNNFHISFPMPRGTLGWIIAMDRDIDLYKQTLEFSQPNTARSHSFADCLFIPDAMRNYVINEEDADCMVIQSTDGNSRVAIGAAVARIVVGATRLVVTDGKVQVDTLEAEINATTATINADTTINGTLTVSEKITAQADIDAAGGVSASGSVTGASGTFGGVSVSLHIHKDAENRNTTAPVV